MSIIYAPYIENTLPAFCADNKIAKIKFPVEHSLAVGDYSKYAAFLKILDLNNNKIYQSETGSTNAFTTDGYFEWEDTTKEFTDKLNIGSYYKIQIAYHDSLESNSNPIGAWSYAGIIKYTSKPSIDLKTDGANHYVTYRTKDISERPYEYEFRFVDNNRNLLYTTKSKFLNMQGSLDLEHWLVFEVCATPNCVIPEGSIMSFNVETVNGLQVSKDFNTAQQNIPGNIISMEANQNEGYFKKEIPTESEGVNIYRSESPNFEKWICFKNVDKIFIDNSVEHNKTYYYHADGLSAEATTDITSVLNFEDMFLSDETRQLRIRYNPKVSSFKKTTLEQKTDTIGGQYPYFFRNGDVGYYEIPISGLISYHMDNEELFIPKEEIGISGENVPTINLVDYNIAAERKFKLEVLNWLNNGKPKLFRSPAEGNYIVRLMNIRLSPDDKLGRMIHTFSATGYEVAELNEENIIKYKLGGAAK